jgi:hypothetical protein
MPRTSTERAALAARFSSSPEQERPAAPAATPGQIRIVQFTFKLPFGRHHAFTSWLGEVAFTLGVSPKWVGLQAGLEELVGLALTDETTARKLEERLRARVSDR